VWKPKDKALQKALFTGKYGTTVYKVQLSISLLGQIVLCTGPHLPLYDSHIWASTMEAHPLEPWEWWLGGTCLLSQTTLATQESYTHLLCDMADGHYIACPNILTPWQKDQRLSTEETLYNIILSWH
jgi:hypothetical protein